MSTAGGVAEGGWLGRQSERAMLGQLFLALDFEGRGVHGRERRDIGALTIHEHADHVLVHFLPVLVKAESMVVAVLLL
jgi:hypothetical protein